jgi:hypothetical protein
MTSIGRVSLAVGLTLAALATAACGGNPASSDSSSNGSPRASTGTSAGKLDPAVAMPSSFPSAIPIYPGARLTTQSSFSSNAQTTWGMTWETLDSADKVQAFYAAQLNQGDWTITFSGSTNGAYSSSFTRKSNSKVVGILGVDVTSGVTKISMALAGV